MERFLAALAAYQQSGWRRDLPEMPVIASSGSAVLRDYGGSGRPVVFVPSLINTANVLDLTAERSLLRYLAGRGVRPLLVDWQSPGAAEADLSVGGYVTQRLRPLLDSPARPRALAPAAPDAPIPARTRPAPASLPEAKPTGSTPPPLTLPEAASAPRPAPANLPKSGPPRPPLPVVFEPPPRPVRRRPPLPE